MRYVSTHIQCLLKAFRGTNDPFCWLTLDVDYEGRWLTPSVRFLSYIVSTIACDIVGTLSKYCIYN